MGEHYDGTASYQLGLCPTAEDLFDRKTVLNPFVYSPLSRSDMDDILVSMDKVLNHFSKNQVN